MYAAHHFHTQLRCRSADFRRRDHNMAKSPAQPAPPPPKTMAGGGARPRGAHTGTAPCARCIGGTQLQAKKGKWRGKGNKSFPRYRSCNARAESQWIVRLADSHTYNTPLLNKVVYNLSISPDTRVVIQRAPRPHFARPGDTPVLWFRDRSPILTRVTSRKGGYRRYSAWILT
jgi:hypothetical protein